MTVSGVSPEELATPTLLKVTTLTRRCEGINKRRIPVVEVATKVLEQDEWHFARADLTIRVVDAVRGPDSQRPRLGISAAHRRPPPE